MGWAPNVFKELKEYLAAPKRLGPCTPPHFRSKVRSSPELVDVRNPAAIVDEDPLERAVRDMEAGVGIFAPHLLDAAYRNGTPEWLVRFFFLCATQFAECS
ncbi:hypothetical protein HIM_05711 [Hirsutella minnesotensis 3608]|uniref:Uncharacterized protein n=1 Tax=Hirsutella minnesotensis 3608 TaxID=1043627 RepID=A0A0F7ZP69_9HYPO|nr:hypothetical protein HIM_05711 [Hirsutella minnesotensis 3608]